MDNVTKRLVNYIIADIGSKSSYKLYNSYQYNNKIIVDIN